MPVFKKGLKFGPKNYRPISLACIACRVLEKSVSKKRIKFFEENGTLPTSQFGFLNERSTVTQLLGCLNSWTRSYDRGNSVCVAYLDFAKAFDSVPHAKLLHVL